MLPNKFCCFLNVPEFSAAWGRVFLLLQVLRKQWDILLLFVYICDSEQQGWAPADCWGGEGQRLYPCGVIWPWAQHDAREGPVLFLGGQGCSTNWFCLAVKACKKKGKEWLLYMSLLRTQDRESFEHTTVLLQHSAIWAAYPSFKLARMSTWSCFGDICEHEGHQRVDTW